MSIKFRIFIRNTVGVFSPHKLQWMRIVWTEPDAVLANVTLHH